MPSEYRTLLQFDMQNGGQVLIMISRDVEASTALDIVETMLPTLKNISALADEHAAKQELQKPETK